MASSQHWTTLDTSLERCSPRPAHVSQSSQRDELHNIFVMLWLGMALGELMNTMEVYHGFRATEDQYKKKFKDWYRKGLLPPKKRKRVGSGKGGSKAINACSSLRNGQLIPWLSAYREHGASSTSLTSADTTGFKREDTQLVHIEKQINDLIVSEQPQKEYIHQLSNLWDAHFDAEFGDAKLVDVQAAVESMIQFLVNVSATDFNLWESTTRPGDRGLLHLVSERIWRCYPTDEWLFQGLGYVTLVVPVLIEFKDEWPAFRDRTATVSLLSDSAQDGRGIEHERDTGLTFIDSAQDWQKLERRKISFGDVLVFLCK